MKIRFKVGESRLMELGESKLRVLVALLLAGSLSLAGMVWIGAVEQVVNETSASKRPRLEVRSQVAGGQTSISTQFRVVFTNSSGQRFVEVPVGANGARPKMCQWPTRVKDWARYWETPEGKARGDAWKHPGFQQEEDHPVVNVSWEDAVAYCDWLTQYERADKLIGETERYRLPTDREWSWAVGLGDELGKTPQEKSGKVANVFPWGKEWPPPRAAGNFGVIPRGIDDGYTQTSPVEKFRVNALGLYDTAGNVWIWCEDWYNGEKQRRVLRGGSWLNHKEAHLRSSSRNSAAPNYRDYGIGFRVVLIQEEN